MYLNTCNVYCLGTEFILSSFYKYFWNTLCQTMDKYWEYNVEQQQQQQQ